VPSPDAAPGPDPVAAMWDAVKRALHEAGDPSPLDIERLSVQYGLPTLAASTTAEWFKDWAVVPRWNNFDSLVKCLGAENDPGVDWKALHTAASRASRDRSRRPKEDDEPAMAAPVPSHAPPVPPEKRRWPWIVLGVGAILLVGLLIGFGRTPAAPPPRDCAYVVADVAPVYAAPDAGGGFVKNKRKGDRVELVDRPAQSGRLAVLLPRDPIGIGWMERSQLTGPVPCPTPPGGR
jgi:hypothetical protein